MIHIRDACLEFGTQKVFDNLNLTVDTQDRIGLVGRNGSGKSTLLKAIIDNRVLEGGSIVISGKCRVAYMPQEMILNSTRTIVEEALSAYKEIGPLREKVQALEPLVQKGDAHAAEEYGHCIERLAELHVDGAIRRTKEMLLGLGFKEKQLDDPMSSLSVGWQMRIVLAKLLLQDADFYLFDEPTNHLDIVAKDWFVEFLKEASFGFMLVCHDKYFLDKLCTKIFELERGKGTLYQGNYQNYEEQKEHDLLSLEQAFKQQQKDIKQKQRFVDRFRAKSSKAKLAKSMEKSLQKIERIELPPSARTVNFSFNEVQRAGRVVLEVTNLSFSYPETKKPVFENVTFQIERGQRVAVVAPNGGGKTTLFNVLCGKLQAATGTVHLGYNVIKALFEQEQHKVLDPNKTVLEEVLSTTYNKPEQQIRKFLGSFLFSKNEVVKKTKVLSGGERNRVSMVKVLLQDANFLLLDEPTNHLDIQSKEILLKALQQFDGTILFVSHDHDFINKLSTRVLELTPQGIYSYFGNYESFLAQKKDTLCHEQQTKNTTVTTVSESKQKRVQGQKELQQCERTIARLEKTISHLQEQFADFEYGTQGFADTQKKLEQAEKELEQQLKVWETLQEK